MKKIILLILLSAYFFVDAQSWKIQNTFETTSLTTIQFHDSLHGFTLGFETDAQGQYSMGLGKFTINGGKTWKPSSFNQTNIIPFRSKALNNTDGFFVGSNISGFGVFGKTTDGGTNWEISSHDTRLFDLHFYTNKRGIIAGRNGYIGLTNDAGKTWYYEINPFPSTIYSIDIQDFNNVHWILACGAGGNFGYSKDSGKTWTIDKLNGVGELTSITLDNKGNAWMCSFNGEIFRSSDTGKTWIRNYSNNFDAFNHLIKDQNNKFWICGDFGQFMTALDTGWIPYFSLPGEHENVFDNITDASFSIENVGWFCTSEGKIISTKFLDTSSNSTELLNIEIENFKISTNKIEIAIKKLIDNNISYTYEIISLDGKVILNGILNSELTLINTEYFQKGIYLLNISGNSRLIVKPLYLY